MYLLKEGRQVVPSAHGQHHAADAQDLAQQHPQHCGGGTNGHHAAYGRGGQRVGHHLQGRGAGCHLLSSYDTDGHDRYGRIEQDGGEDGDDHCTRDGLLRMVHLLRQGGDACIAGEGEEKQGGSFGDAGDAKGGEGSEVALLHYRDPTEDKIEQGEQGEGHNHQVQQSRFFDAEEVDHRQEDHRHHRDEHGRSYRQQLVEIAAKADGHHTCGRELADQEHPAGREAEGGRQQLVTILVGTPRVGIDRRQLGRAQPVEGGDDARDDQSHDKGRT